MTADLIIIGGGPAGYVGAIPTKALLESAEMYRKMSQKAESYGLKTQGVQADWDAVVARSRSVSDRLCSGFDFLFKKHGIERVEGTASIPSPGVVEVTAADGSINRLEAPKILVATGARTREIPTFPMDGNRIVGSKEALTLPRIPESMLVIGSGAIGSEFWERK